MKAQATLEMERIFTFTSPREHYSADACIVWCLDDRFTELCEAFIKDRGFTRVDRVIVAGGAKSLASPEHENDADRYFISDQVKKSLALHNPRRIILMTHSDCGAYGGKAKFGSDEGEIEIHRKELVAAREALAAALDLRGIEVETVFADFEGLRVVL